METESDLRARNADRSDTAHTAPVAAEGETMMSMNDFQGMDSAAMQQQMLFMASQMAKMTKELERLQTKSSPDNKRKRGDVGLGSRGRSEEDDQVRGLYSEKGSGGLGDFDDNEHELSYLLAESFAPTSGEWQLVRPKHMRKQGSVDAHTDAIAPLNRTGADQSGHGLPSEVSFLAACGVLPPSQQEAVILPAHSTNRERRQWDPGK